MLISCWLAGFLLTGLYLLDLLACLKTYRRSSERKLSHGITVYILIFELSLNFYFQTMCEHLKHCFWRSSHQDHLVLEDSLIWCDHWCHAEKKLRKRREKSTLVYTKVETVYLLSVRWVNPGPQNRIKNLFSSSCGCWSHHTLQKNADKWNHPGYSHTCLCLLWHEK